MSNSITLKTDMTITSSSGRWLPESAWTVEHTAFAAQCACFAGSELQRTTWLSTGKRGHPAPLGVGYLQAGRWILESENNESSTKRTFHAAAELQWEDGLFTAAWLSFSDLESTLAGEQNPAFWLMEAVIQRLAPDHVMIQGDGWLESLKSIAEMKTLAVPTNDSECLKRISTARIDREAWEKFPGAESARKDLNWLRRQVARENREQEFAAKPRKRPLLLRILFAFSPMRGRRSGKMIHPIDRLKRHLA